MTFDPRKRTSWKAADLRRAQLLHDLKLYGLVLLIMVPPTALALWAILEWV